MQELFLGREIVSLSEGCPHFKGVLRERRFRCVVEMYVRDESPLLCVGQCIIDAVSVQHC